MADSLDFSKQETRDAMRLAIQTAVAAAAMYSTMQALDMPEKFVGVLSAVLVVQPSLGSTVKAAWNRIVATLIGSLVGLGALAIVPGGYGPAVALALSMIVLNAASAFRPDWRYGVVAAIALSLGSESNVAETAADRALAIGLGALLGSGISLVVWPEQTARRVERRLSTALRAIAERLDTTVERARDNEDDVATEARDRYHRSIQEARVSAEDARLGDPEALRDRVEKTNRLYNSIIILNRVAERSRQAATGDDTLEEALETMRKCSCRVAKSLAEGQCDNESMEAISDALDRSERAVTGVGEEGATQLIRCALLFGLGEVRNTLKELHSRRCSGETADEEKPAA